MTNSIIESLGTYSNNSSDRSIKCIAELHGDRVRTAYVGGPDDGKSALVSIDTWTEIVSEFLNYGWTKTESANTPSVDESSPAKLEQSWII